jgi:hypothetical protein
VPVPDIAHIFSSLSLPNIGYTDTLLCVRDIAYIAASLSRDSIYRDTLVSAPYIAYIDTSLSL